MAHLPWSFFVIVVGVFVFVFSYLPQFWFLCLCLVTAGLSLRVLVLQFGRSFPVPVSEVWFPSRSLKVSSTIASDDVSVVLDWVSV